MKKFSLFIFVLVFGMLLVGCDNKSKVYDLASQAFNNVNEAYTITEEYGSDIYEGWRLGIYNNKEIIRDGNTYLAKELGLSKEELDNGMSSLLIKQLFGSDIEKLSGDKVDELKDLLKKDTVYYKMFEDSLFSFVVNVVSETYKVNGKAELAQEKLDLAKKQMKEMSDQYSDYEHYSNLKGYFTTTNAFFDFCQNPTGSFEQVKDTINKYKNEARDYKNDLAYIFED